MTTVELIERIAILETEAVAATRLFEIQEKIAKDRQRIIEMQGEEIEMLKQQLHGHQPTPETIAGILTT